MRRKGPNPVDKHVGNRVRMRRLMLHVTQERLAEALGITFQQVQKYEKGTNRIKLARADCSKYRTFSKRRSVFFRGSTRFRSQGSHGGFERYNRFSRNYGWARFGKSIRANKKAQAAANHCRYG